MDAGANCFLRAAGGEWKRGVEQSMADHGATLSLTNGSHTVQATVVSIDGGVFTYILAYKLGAEPAALRAWLMSAAEPGETEVKGQEVWNDRANNAQITRLRQPGGVQLAYRVAYHSYE
ncbi:hypothetical protein GCM10022407_32260 [Hymenobacter antarcticus]|uniref:Uncharacterized protein n=2 Tax=Hymenobacter antarcticus TaxID=486270 RepID=A0ABP7QLZ9_9BACT